MIRDAARIVLRTLVGFVATVVFLFIVFAVVAVLHQLVVLLNLNNVVELLYLLLIVGGSVVLFPYLFYQLGKDILGNRF